MHVTVFNILHTAKSYISINEQFTLILFTCIMIVSPLQIILSRKHLITKRYNQTVTIFVENLQCLYNYPDLKKRQEHMRVCVCVCVCVRI